MPRSRPRSLSNPAPAGAGSLRPRIARFRTRGQQGFSIVAAIFILVILAGLGAYLVSSTTTQHQTLALDAMSARAHQAARTGIEWGGYQVIQVAHGAGTFPGNCDTGAGYTGAAAATQTLGGLPGLADFRVTVECHSNNFVEAGVAYRVYQLVATACNGDQATCPDATPPGMYVEHQQRASIRFP